MNTEITKEKWNAYREVQMNGVTNMFDVRVVVALAGGVLTREDCLAIMQDYGQLKEKYEGGAE